MEDEDEDLGDWPTFCSEHAIDRRLARAITDLSWESPTLVQRAAIPVALKGRDVLIQARTGSGKTGCYAIPMLQAILRVKEKAFRSKREASGVLGVVLAPTRELVAQARRHLVSLIAYCREEVSVLALVGEDPGSDAESVAVTRCDVVVATPAALNEACLACNGEHPLLSLRTSVLALVVDEADLVLSFGYDDDIEAITRRLGVAAGKDELGRRPQGFLLSATLGNNVAALKRVALQKAATVRLRESSGVFGGDRDDEAALAQYYIALNKDDKLLITYVLLKLGILEGRGILFVNGVDSCYRLKLFLNLFAIRCLVLNAELPLASRLHTIESYNRGYYDLLVATDASVVVGDELAAEDDADDVTDQGEASRTSRAKRRRAHAENADNDTVDTDKRSGVARGIDFQNVNWVLNVDFPKTAASYTHRIGRTARAGARGTALSLVATDDPIDRSALECVREEQPAIRVSALATAGACSVVAAIGASGEQSTATHLQQPVQLAFDTSVCESFRYRVSDVKRGVTRAAVREARAAELKREILNSKQLEAYFDAHPNDLSVLKQERIELHVHRDLVANNLKHVPSYLVPHALRAVGAQPRESFKRKRNPKHRAGAKRKRGDGADPSRRKDNDPLQTFDSSGLECKTGVQSTTTDGPSQPHSTPRIYSETDPDLMKSTVVSNRMKWKQKHRKGPFAKKPKTRQKKKYDRRDTKPVARAKF